MVPTSEMSRQRRALQEELRTRSKQLEEEVRSLREQLGSPHRSLLFPRLTNNHGRVDLGGPSLAVYSLLVEF